MYLFRRYFTETASAGDIPAAAAAADLGAPRGAQDGEHGTGGTGRCPRRCAVRDPPSRAAGLARALRGPRTCPACPGTAPVFKLVRLQQRLLPVEQVPV